MENLVKKYDFKKLCPLDIRRERQWKHVEFVLKFFAFSEQYSAEIKGSLDIYMWKMTDLSLNNEEEFKKVIKEQESDFNNMISIVKEYIWSFSRPGSDFSSSQRFEWISIGINRATKDPLYNKEKLQSLKDFVYGEKFIGLTTIKWWANATNAFNWRVDAVKDFLCS